MLSNDQQRILVAVLDALIPPSEEPRRPGAGAVGVGDHVAGVLARSPEHEPLVAAGLSALGVGFLDLAPRARADALSALAASQPGFLPFLIFQTYRAYYQTPAVLEALGLPPRPPYPQGYAIEPSDWTLLARVRARGKLYRDA
jgi:hypothetical protein